MAEVQSVKKNGLTLVSTFSGCGGSCLGFRMAGFRTLWASEFIPEARDSYRANAERRTVLDERDIREVKPEEILEAIKLKRGEIDVLEGSPPCSSFSTAGKRESSWGKVKAYSSTKQRTDDLFFEFVRLLKGLQPRAFVAENVSGLVKGVAKGFFLEILAALKGCGYAVECRLLDAQWLGVPQARQRTIFVGVREDLGLKPAFPKPLAYRYSIRDAIPWIDSVEGGNKAPFDSKGKKYSINEPVPTIIGGDTIGCAPFQFKVRTRITGRTGPHFKRVATEIDEPMNAITVSDPAQTRYEIEHCVEPDASMERHATGREYDKIGRGRQSKKYFQLVKPRADEPCPTVTAAGGNAGLASVAHPYEKRKFSIAELKRLCSFPDDFVLTGTYAQQWERLGRSVPPLMMRAVAERIRDDILLKP